ncbi:hypothetical protein [Paraburkholderia caffeinilytica]|uniref:hypothetical protein n=1 Tax=Paraburkholderia caffeinilytica TaxID=1761016 RepID=UPI0038BA3E9B
MAIDASIPLMSQAPKVDMTAGIAQVYTLADLINKQKQDQAVRQALSAPGALDPATGMPTSDTLGAVTRANPSAGMALQKNYADIAEKQSTTNKNNAQAKNFDYENGVKQMDALAQAGGALMTQYSNLLKQGVPQQQAIAQIQPMYERSLEGLRNGGLIDAQHFAQAPKQFNPDQVANGVFQALSVKDQFTAQHQQNQDVRADQDSAERSRHNRVEEGQGAQRVGIEAQNAATNRGRLNFEMSKPETEVGKLNADLKAGRIGKDDYNAALTKATGGSDPATIDTVAKSIADGTMPPMTGQALRTPAGLRIMARVHELNPDYDAKDYGASSKAVKDFSTGKQGNTVRSLNVAMSHLDVLNEAGQALKNGNSTDFNRLAQNIAARTGNPAPTNFNEAKKIVSDEVVKAIVGAGGGVSDREEAAKAFNDANSPAQLAGAISTAKKLLGGQLQGLKKQYETSTGKDDFNKRFLSPATQLLEDGGGVSQSSGGAGGGKRLVYDPSSGTFK